ncbi:DUF3990 domain-containing protein [Neobacillus sp. PS3-12]|uniref:DUF3990 domain-containing protein n=1 Tax=Neobacillus sp. PS3-12 TaxID=3070677 RepID=UPI0027E0858C|nr:DUF3990 domain-containing protein [Neobacillus sp. PS3-12]WML54321.1 DUF3990 domain-containing protein [Neobacillus sp. PS3-12]
MSLVQTIDKLPNTLYHGTTSNHVKNIASRIDLNACMPQTDFSKGFYLTSNFEQAKVWAEKKEKAHNIIELGKAKRDSDYIPDIVKGVIVHFDVDLEGLSFLNGLHFPKCTPRWANFVYANRSEKSIYELELELQDFNNRELTWDYVYGPLGDGSIMGLTYKVDDGEMTLKEFYQEIQNDKYIENKYDQLSLHTRSALEFIEYKKVVLTHAYGRTRKVTSEI